MIAHPRDCTKFVQEMSKSTQFSFSFRFFFHFISQLVRLLHREHQHPSGWKKDTVWHEPFGECPFVHFSFFFLFNRAISNTQKEKHPSSLEHFFSTVSTTKRRNRKIQHTPKYRSYAHFFFQNGYRHLLCTTRKKNTHVIMQQSRTSYLKSKTDLRISYICASVCNVSMWG